MKKLTVIAAALLLAHQAQATTLPQAAALARTTTPEAHGQMFDALEQQILQAERQALQNGAPALTRPQLEQAKQSTTQADRAWLKASGYDFQVKANQQAGITLLSAFSTLPQPVLEANRATVADVNLNATQGTRHQALADAEGISYLYFTADALGPRLGKAFLAAYDKGELSKAAAQRRALPAGYPLSGATPEQQFWQRLDLSAANAQAKHQG